MPKTITLTDAEVKELNILLNNKLRPSYTPINNPDALKSIRDKLSN